MGTVRGRLFVGGDATRQDAAGDGAGAAGGGDQKRVPADATADRTERVPAILQDDTVNPIPEPILKVAFREWLLDYFHLETRRWTDLSIMEIDALVRLHWQNLAEKINETKADPSPEDVEV